MSGLGRSNLIDHSPSFSDSQDDSDDCVQESWIEWWTHLKGNEFLCEVSEEFLRDEFNLYGFSAQVDVLPFFLNMSFFLC
jgi:casein kinase II subunit beta